MDDGLVAITIEEVVWDEFIEKCNLSSSAAAIYTKMSWYGVLHAQIEALDEQAQARNLEWSRLHISYLMESFTWEAQND